MAILIPLGILSLLAIWQFIGYPLLMGLVALKANPREKDALYTPFVSIVVPAYNEAQVIQSRIRNLDGLDYPRDKYEIIIVESGSSDATAQIVEGEVASRRENRPRLKLVRETARKGKASAINFGKRHASGEVVLVTDANAVFSRNVLREMMPHFADPRVGAVGGRYVVANPDQGMAAQESFYWDLEYIMRRGESALDSACLFHGEINAWRKRLVEADTTIISEDLDMAIQIRRQGYRIAYEPKAVACEYTGATAHEQIVRRKKVSTGTMLCMRKHLGYFIPPRDLYSALIFPSHKGLVMFSPFTLLAILLLYLISWNPWIIVGHLVVTGAVAALLFGALMVVKGKLVGQRGGGSLSPLTLLRITRYVLLNEYLLILAWIDFALGRHTVLWERAESTRVDSTAASWEVE